jgi:peptidyl-prolyl cis-trans isomerase C
LRTSAVALLFCTLALGTACRGAAESPNPSAEPAPAATSADTQAPEPTSPTAAPAVPAAPKPVPQELPAVVAKVNGEDIARQDFERAVAVLESRAGGPVPAERRDEILRGVLDQLITYRLLTQEARQRKLEASDQEVQARLAEVRQQFANEQAFTNALKERNLDLTQFTADTRSDLTVGKLVDAEAAGVPPAPDSETRAFYDQNPDQFKQPEMVRASHILARADEAAGAEAKAQAKAKMQGVLKELRSGADFAEMARKHSDDGSAEAGGDLNYFGPGQMVPAFEQAAFALKSGHLSDIVETPFGYHIIKVTDRKPGRTVPYDEVKAQIANYLQQQQQREKADALVDRLRAKAKIEILI